MTEFNCIFISTTENRSNLQASSRTHDNLTSTDGPTTFAAMSRGHESNTNYFSPFQVMFATQQM